MDDSSRAFTATSMTMAKGRKRPGLSLARRLCLKGSSGKGLAAIRNYAFDESAFIHEKALAKYETFVRPVYLSLFHAWKNKKVMYISLLIMTYIGL